MRHTASPSIPVSYSRLIAQELGMQARDLPELLEGTPLTSQDLLDERTRLTSDQQVQILDNALLASGDPGFGLRLGRRLTPAAHGPMGYLASSSPDLLAAVEAIGAFLPTRMSFVRLELTRDDVELIIECRFEVEMSPGATRCMAEVCAMTFFSCAEFIIGRRPREVETHLNVPDPGWGEAIADDIPGRIVYSADNLHLRVPMELCRIPNASANHESAQLARAQCEAILAQLQGSEDSYRRRVETMMLSQPTGRVTEASVAEALFISKRTLARRLHEEGAGFRQIRQEIADRQATSHLSDSPLSVDEIAALLGYHDSANFRRAFKSWRGMTPEQYRAAAGAGQG